VSEYLVFQHSAIAHSKGAEIDVISVMAIVIVQLALAGADIS